MNEETKYAIKLEGVYKSYDAQTDDTDRDYVLKNIDLKIKENEFICALGPSGCGKSTMLNLIAGYIKPNQGSIEIYGEDVTGSTGCAGVVFQDHALLPWLTVKKNIALGPKLNHKSNIKEITQKYIKMVGLEGLENA